MKNKITLTIASYNIQFSLHPESLVENINIIVKNGADIICLQEVIKKPNEIFIIDQIVDNLGKDWHYDHHLEESLSVLGMGNCILWNSKRIKLEHISKITLPTSGSLAIHERIFSYLAGGISKPFKRRVLLGYFCMNSTKFTVANIHLDHNGGINNRKQQLSYLMQSQFKNSPKSIDVIAGDFNNFDLLKSGKEKRIYSNILGNNFIDATANIDSTADFNKMKFYFATNFLGWVVKRLDFHIKRKLDYIWVKNATILESKKLNLNGSDHLPILVKLII